MKYETPLELRIPLPEDFTRNSGTEKRNNVKGGARITSIRFSNAEITKIEAAAKVLDVPFTSLIRHCAVKYAEGLLKHRNNWIKEQVNAGKEPHASG